jgi:hypothetical protein
VRARHWHHPGTSLARRLRAPGPAVTLGLCLVAVAGCGILPIGGRVTAPAGVTPGRVVDPGARPDPATCERRIRADIVGAVAVRGVLASSDFGPLPIATDEATARQAAADPASDIATFGIPVTADELAASLASGIEIDSTQPVVARMWAARDRYGERWLDARGTFVVAVMSDAAATALRCFEPADRQVRYVEAGWSSATLTALQDRITADWQSGALKQAGIDVRMTGQTVHDDVMVVEVTVHGLTPAIAGELRRRYGDPVLMVEGEGAMPA